MPQDGGTSRQGSHVDMCLEIDNMTLLVRSTKSRRRSGCNVVHVESLETGRKKGQQPNKDKVLMIHHMYSLEQEDSWECGYYVMSWIRTIIRAAVKDEWIERFKNLSPLPDDIIHTLRQEWVAYLLERWS
ncbi:hypothetical protein DEO72_LG6g874 [Vigna unguiculata]|uniref:Ulp1 protease family n=1 Tax=Vigna unguiculata TaxID=3917 RepID=A0A4D6M4J1_VIGUN|nr:hypothetical protein DEO72_LG6g874 [Vigna unguiculata]